MTKPLPPSASVAHTDEGEKLFAPSAERNKVALLDVLAAQAPRTGHVLEVASGTGQHISAFATAFPALHWHPTELDAARRASIDAYASDTMLGNIEPAVALDISQAGWGKNHHPKMLILCTNLTHLISTKDTQNMIVEAAKALAPDGKFILYGPFKRGGILTSDGDAGFDAELRGSDPAIGYKDDLDIIRWLRDAGLEQVAVTDMPANNLCFIAGHPCP